MKIVKLKGGLGNQMFQYAYAKLIEKRTGDTVKLDYSAYESLEGDMVRKPRIMRFCLTLPAADKNDIASLCKLSHKGNSLSIWYKVKIYLESKLNPDYVFEPNRAYMDPQTVQEKLYFDGYWQSYRYVEEVKDILTHDFTPVAPLSEKTLAAQKKMQGENAVFVGVRKGDYTQEIEHYGSFDSVYYQKAMARIEQTVEDPVYYVFSNDVDWCKENMDWGGRQVIYREPEDQTDDFEELMLMASCKHAIMVNSTYHWWGAALISNPDKIICCPEIWFFDHAPIDILPASYIKISSKTE